MSRDQQDSHGFGICVKGGKETGHGVYISRIEDGSLAERAGLRPGDTILEVNGTPFTSVSHDDALKVNAQTLYIKKNDMFLFLFPTPNHSIVPYYISVHDTSNANNNI